MLSFENIKYSSAALKSVVVKQQIVSIVADQYKEDLGEMKLELFKNSGGYEDLIKDCVKRIEVMVPHGENHLILDKKQLVVDVFKSLFPEITALDEANIARFIGFIVGAKYKTSFSTAKWIWRRVRRLFCTIQKKNDKSTKTN